ncbi:hypothetical protein BpHYR1_051053 [Brachionus plicatilis]|uniref:Uncharacterized protein n=1 Tax=Brachionus plicatilis TaxID=10195 RepID=A0A3M7PR92_BRAPC|nr:hypothetical protein BpHYR1_051053 [Brachionus plicatilis]
MGIPTFVTEGGKVVKTGFLWSNTQGLTRENVLRRLNQGYLVIWWIYLIKVKKINLTLTKLMLQFLNY